MRQPKKVLPAGQGDEASELTRQRILGHARKHFLAYGYSALTMADLATELGLSKKTLYVHFPGKDEIVRAVIVQFAAEIRRDVDELISDKAVSFGEKLHRFIAHIVERLGAMKPATVRDLQRFAPGLYHHIEEMRQINIPYVFGRLIAEGQKAGAVRADLDAAFALEFFLQAMQGLMQPATMDRLGLQTAEVPAHGIRLFFGGLFTPTGRKEYEKLFPH